MLAQCVCFESGTSDFAELGTDRHAALKAHYVGDDSLLNLLDEESQAGIRWAADYIRVHSRSDHPPTWEQRGSFTAPNFDTIDGTPDVVSGPELFDFKWRYRDYTAQVAAYAAMVLEQSGFGRVTCHLLFGDLRRAEKLVFDRPAVEAILTPIFDRLDAPRHPTPCDYCGWCSQRLTCKAMTRPATVVGDGYQEPGLLDLSSWRPSEMLENPEHLAFALKLWRLVLKKWGESVEFHAMEAATKLGKKLPGFDLKTNKGKKFVPDTNAAYLASGLPPAEFLQSCQVRLNTSKKYPDQLGLDSLFKKFLGLPTSAAAKREVTKKLGDTIQQRRDTLKLVSVKSNSEDEEDE